MEIGSIIMKKRKELGITQQVLAKKIACVKSGGIKMGKWSFPNKRILETIHETPACFKGITIEYYIF